MVILLWVTMVTPPWLSTAWGLWFGLAGAGTHARVNAGVDTQVAVWKWDCVRVHGVSSMRLRMKQSLWTKREDVHLGIAHTHLAILPSYICCVKTCLFTEESSLKIPCHKLSRAAAISEKSRKRTKQRNLYLWYPSIFGHVGWVGFYRHRSLLKSINRPMYSIKSWLLQIRR